MLEANVVILEIDKPNDDPQVRGNALKTLFVARLSYDVKEDDLAREFGRFGPIERASHATRKAQHEGDSLLMYDYRSALLQIPMRRMVTAMAMRRRRKRRRRLIEGMHL